MNYTGDAPRLVAETARKGMMIDRLTGASPSVWRGADWQFDLCGFSADTLLDVSNMASLTLEVKNFGDPAGVALLTQTLTGLDNSVTLAQWLAGTGQHARFSFGHADTNLVMAGALWRDFFLCVKGWTNSSPADHVVWGVTTLRVTEAGINNSDPPTPGSPEYYTTTEADAAFIHDIAVELPLVTSGGRSPTLSVNPGTIVGQSLIWDGSAWVAGAPGGTPYATCAADGKIMPIIAILQDGEYLVTLGPPIN